MEVNFKFTSVIIRLRNAFYISPMGFEPIQIDVFKYF